MKRPYPLDAEEREELRPQDQEAITITDPRTLIPAGGIGPLASGTPFHKISQGTPIHGLLASSTSPQNMQINAITRAGTINSDGVVITVDEEALLSVSAQTFKVLIMYLSKATEQLPRGDQITAEAIQRSRAVSLTLEDYMTACRIKDKKTARDQLNAAVGALYGISLEWEETEYKRPEGKSRKVKERISHRMRIIEHTITSEKGKPVSGGKAEVWLTYSMAEYLSGAYIMPYPSALLTINTHNNPYSIPLGWKLCALDNVNITNNHPERVGRTTVQTLLKAAKGIPRYNVIAEKGQVFDRIIKPFDRDMYALVKAGVLSSYSYFDDKGNTISSNALGGLSYLEFSALNVSYHIQGYPDQTPRLEAKQRRISAAINRARRAARKDQKKAQDAEEDSGSE